MDKLILNILKKIEKFGYEAFIVGGYVRDKLLGIDTNDVDICTNALPDDIIKIFKLNKDTKSNYGSINIRMKKYNIDITTYRCESNYNNHRPNIKYINDLKLDLLRRDFRVNSILMNSKEEIIDVNNGIEDLNNKLIKCIGNTKQKLSEDPLRILRAIRFSVIYDFKLDKNILEFIKENKELIRTISYFRKKEELDKILYSKNKLNGLKLLKNLELLDVLEINYNEVKYTEDIYGIYSQINFSEKYPFSKETNKLLNSIKEIIELKDINNYTLYKYGLYVNKIAGEILGIELNKINKIYKLLPIKRRKDIKISVKSIVKINNNCYNKINEIYEALEDNILSGKLKNNRKEIINFIRKRG